jgi:Uma2 family endonuclease
MTTGSALLTAEQYRLLPDNGQPTELIRGKVVPVGRPVPWPSSPCAVAARILAAFVEPRDLGRVLNLQTGLVTERGPDTVRRGGIAFCSYVRLPRGPLADGLLAVVPELMFEARAPSDPPRRILTLVAEYINAGAAVVCALEPDARRLTVYRPEQVPEVLTADHELALPDVLGDFRAAVRQFLE